MKNIIYSGMTGVFILSTTAAVYADDRNDKPHDHGHEMEEVFVTGAPHSKTRLDVLQGSNLIGTDELEQRMAATIGETLSGIPGISSSFFGPGASRPIIRGLDGDRIRILVNGIGSIDASSTSPDHAVAADPLMAERIEVLRGASTLLYGSNAIGGVVNIIDGRIPDVIPEEKISGRLRLGYGSVAEDYSGGASLNVQLGGSNEKALILHVDGYFRSSGDYNIPGYAESAILRAHEGEHHEEEGHHEEGHHEEGHHEEEAFGQVDNSDVDNKGGAVGLSWIGENAMLGFSFSLNDSNYGVPIHGHEEHGHEEHGHEEHGHEEHGHEEHGAGHEEADVRIALDQKRFDLKGNLKREFLIFDEIRLRFGYADYEHKELKGTKVGTIFTNEGWEGRIEVIQREIGRLHGSMGLQVRKRDFEAIGEEAFVPPTTTLQWGVFAVEEVSLDPVHLELGARFDHQTVENKSLGQKRSFSNISLSTGVALHPTPHSLIGLSLGRTERAPTAEELFSNGPHLATSAFEVGNANLIKEKATSLELTLKQESERFKVNVNFYHTWYDNFIYGSFTGLQQHGLNVLAYQQRDARFYGAEMESSGLIFTEKNHRLWLTVSGDIVRAEFSNNAGHLPRIPARTAGLGFKYEGPNLGASGNIRLVDDQTKLAENELKTKGYTELNLDVFWRPYGEERDVTIRLQGRNLSNAERRQHASFLKDLLPMSGRNIKLSVTYGF